MQALLDDRPQYADLNVTDLRKMARARNREKGLGVPGVNFSDATREALVSFIRGDIDTIGTTKPAGGSIDALIRSIVADELGQLDLPTAETAALTITMPDRPIAKLERQPHSQLADVLKLIAAHEQNILLVGPAGTGKTTLCHDIARSLSIGFSFLSLSAGIGEHHLFGRMLPDELGCWKHIPAPFALAYANGGVFLLDEIDAADPNLMVSINAALANGQMVNPITGELVKRHKDCIIIAAANTFGRGADRMYVGRNALDAATLDRFTLATIQIGYCAKLESTLGPREVLDWVRQLRSVIESNKLRRIASTRLVERSARQLAAGFTLDEIKTRYFLDWSEDERAKARTGGAL